MKLYIENKDKAETMLVSAVKSVKDERSIFGLAEETEKANRMVLRPGEGQVFNLELGYILGVEEL